MDLQKMLNTIRANNSDEYKNRIPVATQDNLDKIGAVLLEDDDLRNEFTKALMNKVAFQKIHQKQFKNPLGILKKGKKPFGDTIEEIFVNYAKAESYDPEGLDLLERQLPDVKAIYHKCNRKDKYKVTIGLDELKKAFNSYGDLGVFYNNIINSLYNGDNYDEYLLFKKLLSEGLESKLVKTINIVEPGKSKENATSFVKAVKTISSGMVFPSSAYNGYLDAQNDDKIPVITTSAIDEQYIIIDNATNVAIDVDVLANAFNLSKPEFLAKKIVIDAFPNPNIRAMIIDKEFAQIYDDLFKLTKVENGSGLYETWFLHHHETISASCLVNAVALVVGADKNSDSNIENYSVTTTLKTGVTSSNRIKTSAEGSTYGTTLKGVSESDTITITMGGTDVTSTAYDSTTGKVRIDEVTGDIVITVA